jgi:predicted Ser/Thr protein kinase
MSEREQPAAEPAFEEVVALYLEAADAGRPPDRQEFLARYPQFAARLEAFFANQDQLERMVAPVQPPDTDSWATSAGAAPADAPARLMGRYQILGELGTGGMGRVYRAYDPSLRRTVVIKVPNLDVPAAERFHFRQRFEREAQAVARVKHPHICEIYDVGEHDGLPFVVLEHVEGQTLVKRLAARGRYEDAREAAEIARQVADALVTVHEAGMVHRDLKLGNILITPEGRAVLIDFGLARVLGTEPLTRPGEVLHTPGYSPPEQAAGRNEEIDCRSDVFSLGVVLYRLLTGQAPAAGTTPRQVRPDLDPSLEAIVLRALAAQPEERYPSAAAMRDALAAWLGPATATGDLLDLRVWNETEAGRRNLSIRAPGALPLRAGDSIRISVRRQRPAYLYLLWIDPGGQAGPLYPWKPGRWEERPPNEDSIAELEWPRYAAGQGLQGMPIQPPGGLETLLVLARNEPLATDFDLRERLDGFPGELRLDDPARLVEWCDQGEQGEDTRMALGWDPEPITDPETEIRAFVRDRLGSFFASVQGFSFTTRH